MCCCDDGSLDFFFVDARDGEGISDIVVLQDESLSDLVSENICTLMDDA